MDVRCGGAAAAASTASGMMDRLAATVRAAAGRLRGLNSLAVPFLDSAASPSLTRALYVPWLSARKNRWADYVLYERR